LHFVQPPADAGHRAQVLYYIAGASAKKIHAGTKQQHVNNARYQYPFPQAVPADELVGLEIRLYGYYNFF